MSLKSYENRFRRLAARQLLTLSKSRTRDTRAVDYGTYALVRVTTPGGDWRSRELVVGDNSTGFGLTLEEVEQALNE